MNKLSVFSGKLNQMIEAAFDNEEIPIIPEGEPNSMGLCYAGGWNNSSGSWLDNGWNNSSGSWQNNGWNNSSGSWINNGWNNSSGSWSNQGWSNSSGNWSDSGSSGGGCFLTTACVEHKGLPDDCVELETLRRYRDRMVQEDEAFRSKVLEYYRNAPLILQQIEKSGESGRVYEQLYDDMIKPCVELLEQGREEEAKRLYLNGYEQLAAEYLN